ncbi:hypothetical protein [Chryseobacterium lactis]|uniref:hypothetical protein n=1 Tax=Chryseobacterium lactis TaxID=1241981 RepID=UPI001627B0BE|nr:hypothetical protein [Chryseobacterium lactis]
MKTKFTIKSIFPLLLFPAIIYSVINVSLLLFTDSYYDDKLFPNIFIPSILIFSSLIIFGEIKTKFISVEITQNEIIVKRFLGLQKKKYLLSEIEGLKYSIISSKGGTYEYLYLYKNGNKIVKISQFYHRNYDEVKKFTKTKFKNLGYESFSYRDELKEIFK